MLTREDYDFLFECIEAKERDMSSGHLMGSLLGTMLCPDKDSREKFMAEEENRMSARRNKERLIRERCILLKAKLIGIRDQADAEAFLSAATR